MSEVMDVSNQASNQFGAVVAVREPQFPIKKQVTSGVHLTPVQIGIKVGEVFTTRVEGLEKVVKNSQRLIEIGSKLKVLTSASVNALSTTLKSAVDVFDSIKFVVMLHLFFCPQKNGKYFLFDKKNSDFKKIDRTFLAGHLAFKTARVLNKWELIDLGKIAAAKIGRHLSVFNVVTDSLMTISCVFNCLDTSKKMLEYPKKQSRFVKKIEKWEARPILLKSVEEGNQEVIAVLAQGWLERIEANNKRIASRQKELLEDPSEAALKELSSLEKAQKKLETRLKLLDKGEYKLLQDNLAKANPQEKIIKVHAEQSRLAEDSKISWMKMAASVSKIFVITMALVFTALNLITVLPIVILLAFGIIADSIGLAKVAMEYFAAEK